MPARISRFTLVASLAVLCLVPAAAAALDAGASLRFGFVPERTFQGQPASLSVTVRPKGSRCTLAIAYAGGRKQALAPVVARTGKATWRFTVPPRAGLGRATATVACGKAGRMARTFPVVGPPTAPAKVVVEQSGYSQRVRFTTREVSYGVVLSNPTPHKDALDVTVLVNFIDATNRVVRTTSATIGGVRAESKYYYGSSTTIPDGTPVASLEIVTRIGAQAVGALRGPATSDIQVLGSVWDPGWVGAVQGQLLNDHPTMLLSSTQISSVVFDVNGNVLGGGTGFGSATLLPGVRAYFQANSGVGAIPVDRAVSAGISVIGRYIATG